MQWSRQVPDCVTSVASAIDMDSSPYKLTTTKPEEVEKENQMRSIRIRSGDYVSCCSRAEE